MWPAAGARRRTGDAASRSRAPEGGRGVAHRPGRPSTLQIDSLTSSSPGGATVRSFNSWIPGSGRRWVRVERFLRDLYIHELRVPAERVARVGEDGGVLPAPRAQASRHRVGKRRSRFVRGRPRRLLRGSRLRGSIAGTPARGVPGPAKGIRRGHEARGVLAPARDANGSPDSCASPIATGRCAPRRPNFPPRPDQGKRNLPRVVRGLIMRGAVP